MEKLNKLDKIDKMAWDVESLKDSINFHTKQVDDMTKIQVEQGQEITILTPIPRPPMRQDPAYEQR